MFDCLAWEQWAFLYIPAITHISDCVYDWWDVLLACVVGGLSGPA